MAYNCLEENQILGIGVCLNNRSMRIMKVTGGSGAPNYSELKQEFEKNFQIPVTFDSMISGIARAEVDFMCSTVSSSNLIVIRFSDNIDATIMVRNEIYRGYHNQAMNIAHMIVKPDGERCSCGRCGICSDCERVFQRKHSAPLRLCRGKRKQSSGRRNI